MRNYGFHILLFSLTVCLSLEGCQSSQTASRSSRISDDLMDSYLSEVVKYDGIDKEEALILAKSQLFFQGRSQDFHLDKPQWIEGDEEYWQVSFVPVRRTLADVIAGTELIILIHKEDGEVIMEER